MFGCSHGFGFGVCELVARNSFMALYPHEDCRARIVEETSVVGKDKVASKRLGGCKCNSGMPLRRYPVVYVGCVVGETRAGGVAIVMDDQSDVADNRTVAAFVGDSDAVSSVVIEGA